MRRLKRTIHAYHWMMENHPTAEYGIKFVLSAPRTDRIEREFKSWQTRLTSSR